ncbi:hypothetical protein ACVWYQ_003488 [Bradyrhizobium sp. USDA 3397]
MSPADIFEVELWEHAAVSPLPLRAFVAPLPDEALPSWLLRYAQPFAVAPDALLLGDGERNRANHPDWWRKPDPLVVAALARGTGVSSGRIRSLTFADWPDDGHADAMPERFSRQRFVSERPSHQPRRIGVCPDCLAEDEAPYVRRTWTISWLVACPTHGTVLLRTCPECGAKLRLPGLSSTAHFAPDRCQRCAHRLARAASESPRSRYCDFSDVFLKVGQAEQSICPGSAKSAGLWPWLCSTPCSARCGSIARRPRARCSSRGSLGIWAQHRLASRPRPIKAWRSWHGCLKPGQCEHRRRLQCCVPCALADRCSAGPHLIRRYAVKWRRCSWQPGRTNGTTANAAGGAAGSMTCRRLATSCALRRRASGWHIVALGLWR